MKKIITMSQDEQEQYNNALFLLEQIELRIKKLHSNEINKAYRKIVADLKVAMTDFYYNEIIANKQFELISNAALTTIARITKRRREQQHSTELQTVLQTIVKTAQAGLIKHMMSNYKCIIPGCGQKAIQSHTISKSNNFIASEVFYQYTDNLADHYFYPRPRKKLIAHKRASTFPLFCLHHDSSLFSSIEMNNNIDVHNPEHLLLQHWRTFSFREIQVDYHYNEIKHILKTNVKSFSIHKIPKVELTKYYDYHYFNEQATEKRDIIYLGIALKKSPNILASFCDDLRYISKDKNTSQPELFYLNILRNRDNPFFLLSGFDSPAMRKTLHHYKELFLKDEREFWQEIFKILILNDNVYFEQKVFDDEILSEKIDNVFNQIHFDWNNPHLNYSIKAHRTISKKEACHLFRSKKMFSNIPEDSFSEPQDEVIAIT